MANKLDGTTDVWKLNETVTEAGTIKRTLETAGKFVDRNIEIDITTGAGSRSASGSSTANPHASTNMVTDSSATKWSVTSTADGTWSSTATTTAGFVGAGSSNNSGNATSGAAVVTYIPETAYHNTASTGKTYTDISDSVPPLISKNYLYVNAGYTPDVKISLAKLVPDDSNIKDGAQYIKEGYRAYDNDGVLVAGTAPGRDLELKYSSLTISGPYLDPDDDTQCVINADLAGAYVAGAEVGAFINSFKGGGPYSLTKKINRATLSDITMGGPTYNSGTGKYNVTASAEMTSGYSTSDSKSNSVAINAGSVNTNATVPSGTTATDLEYGKKVKVGAGYYASDVYYSVPNQSSGTKAVVTASSPTINITSVTYNSSTGKYEASSTSATSVSVGTAGYISSSEGTKNGGTATANVSLPVANIDKISLSGPTYNSETNEYVISANQTNTAGYYGGGNKFNKLSIKAGVVDTDSASAATATSLSFGKKIKVGEGYYNEAAYYTVPNQSDGTKATVTSGSASISSLSYTYDSTNKRYNVTGSATIGAPTVSAAGYISSSAGTKNTNTASVSATVAETNMSSSLVSDSTKTSGYSVYRVTASAGYNSASKNSDITVYQGEWS